MENRPPIPSDVKRTVRQRCGYGCVLCGLPLYDYDHMTPWSETRRHNADEITLLCLMHHGEKSRGLLTQAQVEAANADPHNPREGITTPYGLHFKPGESAEMVIGGNSFTCDGSLVPVVVDDDPLIAFLRDERELLLYLRLFDKWNIPRLAVEENVLVMSPHFWDIQFEAGRLTIREGKGEIFLRIKFEPPSRIVLERANLMSNGARVVVSEDSISVSSSTKRATLSRNRVMGSVGITVGYCPSFPAIDWLQFPLVDRYLQPGSPEDSARVLD